MKLECCHADTCLPSYWGGHHLPHLQIPVCPGMTLDAIKRDLRSELMQDAISGSTPPEELSEEWFEAAHAAIDAIEPADPSMTTFFNNLPPYEENYESVFAFFVFRPLED